MRTTKEHGRFTAGQWIGGGVPLREYHYEITSAAPGVLSWAGTSTEGIATLRVEEAGPNFLVATATDVGALPGIERCPCWWAWPSLVFTQYESWDEVSQEVARDLSGGPLTRDIVVQAESRTFGLRTEAEKLRVLYDYVRDEIDYHFVGFGSGDWVAETPSETLQRGSGDCKAKAALLVALLTSVGIEAYPAVVSTTCGDLRLSALPPIGPLADHTVVAVRLDGEPFRVLDPTCEICSVDWQLRSDTDVWVITGGGLDVESYIQIPPRDVDEETMSAMYSVTYAEDGSAQFDATFAANGDIGEILEWAWSQWGDEGLVEYLVWLMAQGTYYAPDHIVVDSQSTSRSNPVVVPCSFSLSNSASVDDAGCLTIFVPRVPLPESSQLASIELSDVPACPVRVVPQERTMVAVLRVPQGYKIDPLPNVLIEGAVGSYERTCVPTESGCVIARKLRLETNSIAPADYPLLAALINAYVNDERLVVVAQPATE